MNKHPWVPHGACFYSLFGQLPEVHLYCQRPPQAHLQLSFTIAARSMTTPTLSSLSPCQRHYTAGHTCKPKVVMLGGKLTKQTHTSSKGFHGSWSTLESTARQFPLPAACRTHQEGDHLRGHLQPDVPAATQAALFLSACGCAPHRADCLPRCPSAFCFLELLPSCCAVLPCGPKSCLPHLLCCCPLCRCPVAYHFLTCCLSSPQLCVFNA